MAKEEGARGFAVIVQEIDEGALHTELSATTQEMVQKLVQHARNIRGKAKGKLSLDISFEAHADGTVALQAVVERTLPKEKRAGTTFFSTAGFNLSLQNQRQLDLGIREVPKPAVVEPEAGARPSINL